MQHAAPPWTAARRRAGVGAALVAAGVLLALTGCGDDPDDAPGGSAPSGITTPTGEAGSTGSRPLTTGPSAGPADEGHPSTPMGTIETVETLDGG